MYARVTLWEGRRKYATKKMREDGRIGVDINAIFTPEIKLKI